MGLKTTGLLGAAMLCAGLALPELVQAGGKRDALKPAEREAAAARARHDMRRAYGPRRANQPAEPMQLLLVEQRPSKDVQAPRLADVYHYDYLANELVHDVVDVASDAVLHSERQSGVQLPLVATEIERAKHIVMATPKARRSVSKAYRNIVGSPLRSLDDLDYKAFIFHADATIEGQANRSARCGVNRCAQLLLYTDDNIALDLSPIVDLSRGRVTDLLRPDAAPLTVDLPPQPN